MRLKYIKIIPVLSVITMMVCLQGCGTSKIIVINPIAHSERIQKTVALKPGNHTVSVDKESLDIFEEVVGTNLYKGKRFAKGDDTVVAYRFIQFDKGNRFKRYLLGGIGNSGEGSLTVECRFINKDGQEIGKTQIEGKIGSGFFGGSMDSAIVSAANSLATYVKKHG